MRKLHKSMLLTLVALAATAVTAPAASAVVLPEVRDQATQQLCPVLVNPNTVNVSGGCFVGGFEGSFNVFLSSDPNAALYDHYDSTFDLRVGPNGLGNAINQTYVARYGNYRRPCDDAQSKKHPWPVVMNSLGGGSFEASIRLCFLTIAQAPGSPGAYEWITVDIDHFGADGWTELNQSNSTVIRNGHWESDNTVGIFEL